MELFRRYPESNARQLIDYNRFASLTGTKVFICLDKGVMEILRYFLNSRARWATTYYTEQSAAGYHTPDAAEMEVLNNALSEANIDMSTCTELNESLQGIIAAINGLSGGSGGCGCIADSGSDVTEFNDNPNSDIPQPEDPLPPGFSTQEEYDTYRCDAANWIFDNYIGTLRNWAGLFGTLGGLTLAVIAGLLLLTVPPVGLSLILAAMGILAGIDIGLLATLSDIADELELVKDDIVCQIYNATTTQEVVDILSDETAAIITTIGPTPEQPFIDICANLISREQAELLFTKDESVDGYGGDCSSCGGEPVWAINPGVCTATITSGSFQADEETTVSNCEGNFFGTTRAGMGFGSNPISTEERAVQFTDVTGGGNFYVTIVNDANPDPGLSESYTAASLASLSVNAYQIQITRLDASDTTPFTVSLTVSVI